MGPAFKNAAVSKEKDDVESFGNADPEKESPVDVAPPVSTVLAEKDVTVGTPRTSMKTGFTPRKLTLLTPRSATFHKGLTSARAHAAGNSSGHGPAISSITYKRSIAPVAELNEMLDRSTSPQSETSSDESSSSLPAPRRGQPRSLRRNKVPPPVVVVNSHADNGFLSAINLKTTARTPKTKEKSRKSFINMYGIRSAEPSVAKHSRMAFGGDPTPVLTGRPLMSAVPTDLKRGAPTFGSARKGGRPHSASSHSTSSSPDVSARLDPVVALSPFMGEFIEQASQAVNSPLLEGHTRNGTDAAPLAWDALVNKAANSPVTARSGVQIKALRRRSKSLDMRPRLKVPPALHSASAAVSAMGSPIRPLPATPLRPGLPATPRSARPFVRRPTFQVTSPATRSNPVSPQSEYFVAV